MKKSNLLVVCLLLSLTTVSVADFWTQKATFPGSARGLAVGVHLGNAGYVGFGKNAGQYFNDWWKYDRATNTWTQLSAFPGAARGGAFAFAVGNNVFVTGGRSAAGLLKDVWMYNPVNNAWLQKNDFPGTVKAGACGFVIGSSAYMGAGMSDTTPAYTQDFWKYFPPGDNWVPLNNLPGAARSEALGMACDSVGYFGLGIAAGNTLLGDFWKYDTLTDAWTAQAAFAGSPRFSLSRFSLFNQVYTGTGFDAVSLSSPTDWWQFDPPSGQWAAKTGCTGGVKGDLVSFSIFNKGYMGVGQQDSLTYTADFWEYTPDSLATTVQDFSGNNVDDPVRIFPNPVAGSSVLELHPGTGLQDLSLYLFDSSIRLVRIIPVRGNQTSLANLFDKSGNYYYALMRKSTPIATGKFMVEQ